MSRTGTRASRAEPATLRPRHRRHRPRRRRRPSFPRSPGCGQGRRSVARRVCGVRAISSRELADDQAADEQQRCRLDVLRVRDCERAIWLREGDVERSAADTAAISAETRVPVAASSDTRTANPSATVAAGAWPRTGSRRRASATGAATATSTTTGGSAGGDRQCRRCPSAAARLVRRGLIARAVGSYERASSPSHAIIAAERQRSVNEAARIGTPGGPR